MTGASATVVRPPRRRQATLYLPEPEAIAVDALRARFNPAQHALIRAHVTLCREDEVDDWQALALQLKRRIPIAVTLRFGPAVREGDLVYLAASGSTKEFDALRHGLLAPGGAPPRRHQPHITLIHPRNGTCSDAAFADLVNEYLPFEVTFRSATLIEQVDGGCWRDLATFG